MDNALESMIKEYRPDVVTLSHDPYPGEGVLIKFREKIAKYRDKLAEEIKSP